VIALIRVTAVVSGCMLIAWFEVNPASADNGHPSSVERPARIEGSPPHIVPAKTPAVAYDSGFAVSATDSNGDVLLFTRSFTTSSWSKTIVYPATDGNGFVGTSIATDGTDLAILTRNSSSGELESFIGEPHGTFEGEVLPGYENPTLNYLPSLAYSPPGNNFVAVAPDSSGDIDYWFSTTPTGGWQEEQVTSEASSGIAYVDSNLVVTDSGVVIFAVDDSSNIDAFYEPIANTGWTETFEQSSVTAYDVSICWSGSEVFALSDVDKTQLEIFGFSGIGAEESSKVVFNASGTLFGDSIYCTGKEIRLDSGEEIGGGGAINYLQMPTNLNTSRLENVATSNSTIDYGAGPGIAFGDKTTLVSDPGEQNGFLYSWTQKSGTTTWSEKKITS
jgi:hypothetical protein